MVEAVEQPQPLIEKSLRLRRGGRDLVMMVAKPFDDDELVAFFRRGVCRRGGCGRGERREQRNGKQLLDAHDVYPPRLLVLPGDSHDLLTTMGHLASRVKQSARGTVLVLCHSLNFKCVHQPEAPARYWPRVGNGKDPSLALWANMRSRQPELLAVTKH